MDVCDHFHDFDQVAGYVEILDGAWHGDGWVKVAEPGVGIFAAAFRKPHRASEVERGDGYVASENGHAL